jgi:DnaJ-class molecular chaperone
MKELHIECGACHGTGLYSGFMERAGEAVVCVQCGGTGRQTIRYNEYTGRKKKRGIKQIRAGSGLIVDQPSRNSWFTYEEFEAKIKPPRTH